MKNADFFIAFIIKKTTHKTTYFVNHLPGVYPVKHLEETWRADGNLNRYLFECMFQFACHCNPLRYILFRYSAYQSLT